jgi:hypothetical protein
MLTYLLPDVLHRTLPFRNYTSFPSFQYIIYLQHQNERTKPTKSYVNDTETERLSGRTRLYS